MGNYKDTSRSKKRKSSDNTHTKCIKDTKVTGNLSENVSCISSKKLKFDVEDANNANTNDYFLPVNFIFIKQLFDLVSACPDCKSKVNITDDYSSRMGFSHKFILTYTNAQCFFTYSNFTSNMVKNDKKGRNMFDVNLKMVIGFREIGRGHQPMVNFS